MKFKKLVKADENFNQKKFDTIDDATHSFYNGLEGTAYYYKHHGLSKEEIMQALEEATMRMEDAFDEL